MKLFGTVHIGKGKAHLDLIGRPISLFYFTLTKNWGIALIKRERMAGK